LEAHFLLGLLARGTLGPVSPRDDFFLRAREIAPWRRPVRFSFDQPVPSLGCFRHGLPAGHTADGSDLGRCAGGNPLRRPPCALRSGQRHCRTRRTTLFSVGPRSFLDLGPRLGLESIFRTRPSLAERNVPLSPGAGSQGECDHSPGSSFSLGDCARARRSRTGANPSGCSKRQVLGTHRCDVGVPGSTKHGVWGGFRPR
jgi:hypothetical protein